MTTSDMSTRVLEGLDEIDAGQAAPSAVYYGGGGEVLDALNEGLRFFCLLTLALETTVPFALTPGGTFYHMRATYPDWLLPLRVKLTDGTRVRPARIEDLDALDSGWQNSPGTPSRYCALGFDFFVIYKQLAGAGIVWITYARAPVALASSSDVPEIPEANHGDLVDYAIYKLRQKEGGGEFQKTLAYFNRFLDGAQRYGDYIRARNKDSGYDNEPFELARFDRSKLMTVGARGQ